MARQTEVSIPRERLDGLMASGLVSGFISGLVTKGMPLERAEAEGFAFRDALFRNWGRVTELVEEFLITPDHNSDTATDMGVIR